MSKITYSNALIRADWKHFRSWLRMFFWLGPIVAVAVFLTGASERSSSVVEIGLRAVQRFDFVDSIERKGVVEPMSSTEVRSGCYWSTNILSIVPEGTWVKEGDIVCVLDSSDVEEYARARSLTLLKYRSRLDAALRDQALLESDNERRLSAAENKYETASYQLREYSNGTFPQEVEELEQKLAVMAESAESVIDETRHVEKLWSMGMVSQREMDRQTSELLQSRESYRVQESKLNLLTQFTHPRSEVNLGHTATQALRDVNRTRLKNSLIETRSRISVLSYQRTIRIYERYMQRAQDSIAACTLRAPCDGQLVYGNSWYLMSRGITYITEGARVRRRQKIFEIPDPERLKVSVPLDESLVYQVSPGMPVTATLAGYEDEKIAGEIVSIPRYPRLRSSYSPGVKDYWLEVELLPTDSQRELIKVKADVAVQIVINDIPDALQIPRLAVTGVAGENWVYVFDGKELVPRRVQLGAANEEMVCVIDGLFEGERLVTEMTQQHKESLRATLSASLDQSIAD